MTSDPADTASATSSMGADHHGLLGRNWGWLVFRGVLALVLGVLALFFPAGAVFGFALVFAAYAGADGIVSLIAGIRGATHKGERWGQLIFSGIIGIAVAVLFVVMPGIATISYALITVALIAFWAIFTGLFEVAAAIRLRKAIKGEWLLALSGVASVLLGTALWVAIIVEPLVSLLSVGWMIGVYALVAGVVLIVLGLRLRNSRL